MLVTMVAVCLVVAILIWNWLDCRRIRMYIEREEKAGRDANPWIWY